MLCPNFFKYKLLACFFNCKTKLNRSYSMHLYYGLFKGEIVLKRNLIFVVDTYLKFSLKIH